ncbi:MAG TPA: L-threonylcarbamoyladenylate synthase [Candidatus Hydrogenedentes bacterium]|nr:L-threonylcarbamoyladenylate synthase [Candidatus Hydrogenedentota bacterium]
MKIVPPTAEGLAGAAGILRKGGVVAYPTETVYGLAVNPSSESALATLFSIKGRREDNPVLLVVADLEQLTPWVKEISAKARNCIEAFWPGPLSLLFPAADMVPDALTAGSGKVCLRCPACAIARELCRAFRGALTSSSANRSSEPPARSLQEITLAEIALGIDGGVLAPSAPSTIYDPGEGRILRPGCISEEELRAHC